MSTLRQFWINVYVAPRNLAAQGMTLDKPIRIFTVIANAENDHIASLAANTWVRGMGFDVKHIQVQNPKGIEIGVVAFVDSTDISYEEFCGVRQAAAVINTKEAA